MFQLTVVPVMSDVVFIFLSSTVVLTPNEQFFSCATLAFSERYHKISKPKPKQYVVSRFFLTPNRMLVT